MLRHSTWLAATDSPMVVAAAFEDVVNEGVEVRAEAIHDLGALEIPCDGAGGAVAEAAGEGIVDLAVLNEFEAFASPPG